MTFPWPVFTALGSAGINARAEKQHEDKAGVKSVPHHSCLLNSTSLTCHCFPRNSELIRPVFVFFLKTTLVCSPLFWFYLHEQPRKTQVVGRNVDLHSNQHIEKRVCYCASAGLVKNQVLLLNRKGCREKVC